MELKVGDTVELNTGKICTVDDIHGDDPLAVDRYGFGPFVINGLLYHENGRFGDTTSDDELSVKRIVGRNNSTNIDKVASQLSSIVRACGTTIAPKTWGDMSDAEKGELLLANYNRKSIDHYINGEWVSLLKSTAIFLNHRAYRVTPEPVREVVAVSGKTNRNGHFMFCEYPHHTDTHRITFETIDGKPDCSTVKMEQL